MGLGGTGWVAPVLRVVIWCVFWCGVDGLHKAMLIFLVKMAAGVHQTSYSSS
jgi:hypothetical protein